MKFDPVIRGFSGKRVIVIGDIMLDHYIYGKSDRISPEAPVPVISFSDEFYSPGGAANVASNISGLNSKVRLVGRTGDDDNGKILTDRLKKLRIPKKYLITEKNYSTPVKTRVISNNQQVVRLDRESAIPQAKKSEKRSEKLIISLINDFNPDAIIISDYNKGFLTSRIISETIKAAKKREVMVIVDPKG